MTTTKKKKKKPLPPMREVPVFCDLPRDEALRRAKHNAEVRRTLLLASALQVLP